MKIRDILNFGVPATRQLVPILDALIAAVNELSAVVFVGENPHLVDDSSNGVSAADAGTLDAVADIEHAIEVGMTAHCASTSVHRAADSTNTPSGFSAASTYAKVKALADDLRTKYNAHRILTASSVHAGADTTNTVVATTIASKATAITVLNALKTAFNAHCGNVTSCHGAADTTNPVVLADLASTATWSQIQAMVDAIRTGYEAHRVLTSGSVHGSADSTNTAGVAAVGSVQTVVNAWLTECKAKLNAHLILAASHVVLDNSNKVSTADATTLNTSIALANALKAAYNDHITRAGEAALTVPTLDTDATV